MLDIRVGTGYDVHRLVFGRKLILGGVEIYNKNKGLLGHSDADVLIHALMDALLGAAALGDIGLYFPDCDQKYKNISSLKLLRKIKELLDKNKFEINNLDCTVIMQAPKIKNYIFKMKLNIARVLEISKEKINIKATTEEGLGITGTCKAIACQASCLLIKKK